MPKSNPCMAGKKERSIFRNTDFVLVGGEKEEFG
jgi:hypothetical protein